MADSNYSKCSNCGTTYHIKAGGCPKCKDKPQKSSNDFMAQCKRIAREMGDDQFFTKKEIKYLPEILRKDEKLLGFVSGLMEGNTWLISLTDRRIIFLDKGMLYGLKQSIVDLNKVNAVSGSTGIMFGTITITDGAVNRTITNVLKKTVQPFTNKVQEAIEALNNKQAQPVAASSPKGEDKIETLKKLAVLKDQGILTEEEFTNKKAEILATI